MLGLFLNPGFLFIAGALISVPIIIHLINRMRFKRIRWAAMEFLLKAQKRTRRRLIIEQLLLLALRCLLIALVGLLVSRFVGCGESNTAGKPSLHLVLLDDTLSMRDTWKQDGEAKNCFDVAKNEFLIGQIAKGLSLSKSNERLIILPLSRLDDPGFDLKEHLKEFTYENLNNKEKLEKLKSDITELQPSYAHVSMAAGVKKAQEIMGNYGDSIVTVHVISDFRSKDWGRPAGEGIIKELIALVEGKKGEVKLRIIDTVHPARTTAQGGYPPSRDNIGIVDFRPTSRIAAKNLPVGFEVVIKNFSSKTMDCFLLVRNNATGKELRELDFKPPLPVQIEAGKDTTVKFAYRFNPDPKINPTPFEHLSVKLTDPQLRPLQNDGLMEDNERHAMVEVRNKVPILVLDGDKSEGRKEGKDSFHIYNGLMAARGRSADFPYQIDFGDEVAAGAIHPAAALEKADLRKYATIFLLNIPDLTANQIKALENYVKDGGGAAFFLGPRVQGDFYTKNLYKEGKGVFPAPIATFPYPKIDEKDLDPKVSDDTLQLLIREDKFSAMKDVPIFGEFLQEPSHSNWFRSFPVFRYYQVNRNAWKQEPNRVFELAALPNEAPATTYHNAVAEITRNNKVRGDKGFLDDKDFAKYRSRIQAHLDAIEKVVQIGSEAKSYELAGQIERFLTDRGDEKLKDSMIEFWGNADARVQDTRNTLRTLKEQVQYGDPFIIARKFGKGKVLAFMSTAGKDWNEFGGGSASSTMYPAFIWEAHNYLSNSSAESNPKIGDQAEIRVDTEQFKGMRLSLKRYFIKSEPNQNQKRGEASKQEGRLDGTQLVFPLTRHVEPGLWVSELVDDGAPNDTPVAVFGHLFNVDTENEGRLQRVSTEELNTELINRVDKEAIKFVGTGAAEESLISRRNDFSESPWLFLLFLLVLVAEQALAVHLSFHLKSDDQDAQPAGLRS